MSENESRILQGIKRLAQPQNYRWLVPLLVALLLLVALRACFSTKEARNGTYVIAQDGSWYPLQLYGREKNLLAFSDDLILEIAKKKGIHIQLVSVNSGDLLESLNDGVDGALTVISPSFSLNKTYLFSQPYYPLGYVLVVDIRSGAHTLEEMKNKFIGIKRGSAVLFSLQGHPEFSVVPYDSLLSMLEDVASDRIDGALVNQLSAYHFVNTYFNRRLKVATPPLTPEGARLATLQGAKGEKLIKLFNEGLAELKADGTWAELLKKWDLTAPM